MAAILNGIYSIGDQLYILYSIDGCPVFPLVDLTWQGAHFSSVIVLSTGMGVGTKARLCCALFVLKGAMER